MTVPFVADNYARADDALRRITMQISSIQTTGESAVTTISQIISDLNLMSAVYPSGWAESIVYINSQAAANPNDEAWQDLKRRKDKLVADFQAQKSRFESIEAAINGL